MGDRTNCILSLAAPASAELQQIIGANYGDPTWRDNTFRFFEFEEVNYATIPADLHHHLTTNKLAFTWDWAAGAEYGPGVLIYHPDHPHAYELDLDYNGDAVLTLDEAVDPEVRSTAILWNRIRREIEK